ncbi:hypothetical protein ACFCYN_24935, partial [Gottfriedia sp. NPDC056225]|uniref:hypothetical protein n=1 Tax=Gottfriedia sp. NPDC056225 TaxID=3345751 RepID=UPI0035D84E26
MNGFFIELIIFAAIMGLLLFIFKVFRRYQKIIALIIIFSSLLIFFYVEQGSYDSKFWSIVLVSCVPISSL